jgi:hypothetical protein
MFKIMIKVTLCAMLAFSIQWGIFFCLFQGDEYSYTKTTQTSYQIPKPTTDPTVPPIHKPNLDPIERAMGKHPTQRI